jgi:hypothetical protein
LPLTGFAEMLSMSPHLTEVLWWPRDLNRRTLRLGLLAFFPWSQLNRFETHTSISVSEFLHILQMSPNLTKGTFKIRGGDHDTSLPRSVIPKVYEKLSDLEVNVDFDAMIGLLEQLTLPGLRSFTVHASSNFDFSPYFEFMAFLSRSRTPLQRLKLSCVMITSNELIDILCLTPSLKNLYIEGWSSVYLSEQFFEALTLHHDTDDGVDTNNDKSGDGARAVHPNLCPLLETLTIRTKFTVTGVLAKMVESRYLPDVQGYTRLKKLDVTLTWDWVESQDYVRLEPLCRKGLVSFVDAHSGLTAWDSLSEDDSDDDEI